MMRNLAVAALLAALSACSTQTMQNVRSDLEALFQPAKGERTLAGALLQYEEGQYPEAATNLQGAIDQGLTERQQAIAHKHLAFIHCSSNRMAACREEFRRALAIMPAIDLAPAEAGHPVWGPIFRSLKAGPTLNAALRQFEDADYDQSAKNLQLAISTGLSEKERASAHKHLAFIHCASARESQCRDEFRKALAVDPALDLAPAEAGHPVWGPIFRSVKAGR